MIGTKKQPRMAASRTTAGFCRSVPETRRHNIHPAVRTGPGEYANATILTTHHDERLIENFECQEIADRGQLRLVRDALPPGAKNVLLFPAKERCAGVSSSG